MFLEDVIPKTAPYREVKEAAAAKQAGMRGGKPTDEGQLPNGKKKQKSVINGDGPENGFDPPGEEDANSQLEMEMMQAEEQETDVDVQMTG